MKNTMKKMMAMMLSTMMMVLAAGNAIAANAEEIYTGKGNPEDATHKNTIAVETITLTESEAKNYIAGNADNNYVRVNIDLDSQNNDVLINATGLSFYYDNELTIVKTKRKTTVWADKGTIAGDYGFMLVETALDPTNNQNGLFVTGCIGNSGISDTGTLYSLCFQLPEDVKAGYFYPVDIRYNSGDKFIYGKGAYDNELADQAWTFTRGITNGGIRIVADPAIPENAEVRGDYVFVKPEVNNVVPETIGNVNGDGNLDSSDASIVLSSYAAYQNGSVKFTEEQMKQADFNGDNAFDSSDAAMILAWYAKAQSTK